MKVKRFSIGRWFFSLRFGRSFSVAHRPQYSPLGPAGSFSLGNLFITYMRKAAI